MAKPLILRKPVIAITGSAGKTTTKEMISAILMQKLRIFRTPGNANAPRHTAQYARKITSYHQAVVLEYGMSHAGQIRLHCQIIQPNIGIVTNVGTAHIGHFNGTVKGIANTKSDLIRYMKPNGVLILNADDKNSKLLDTSRFKGRIIRVSQNSPSDYKAEKIRYLSKGMSFQTKLDGKFYEFIIPVFGKHNIYNALFAIAVSHRLGFTPNQIKNGLMHYRKPYRRLTIYHLKNRVKMIDDTFSANPNAVKAAIDVLTEIGTGTNVAVLGNMLEMGKYAVEGHKSVGRYAAKKKIDYLYTFGYTAKLIEKAATEEGFSKNRVRNFINQTDLTRYLRRHLKPNTTFLFKASHGMELNRSVKALVQYYKKSH